MNTVYISDLDGTLIHDCGAISDYSKRRINILFDNNIYFTVASARSVLSIQEVMNGVKLHLPVVSFNGAFISDLQTGEHHIVNNIDSELAGELLEIITQYGCIPFISTYNGSKDVLYYSEIVNFGMKWYLTDQQNNYDSQLLRTENLQSSFQDKVLCFTIIDRKENLIKLYNMMAKQYGRLLNLHLFENKYYTQDLYWLTIKDIKSSKEQAIKLMLQEWELSSSELVVFGNDKNDIRMFEIADRSIAVANAITKLKKYSTLIIGKNNEDSVIDFIFHDIRIMH